MKITGLTAAQVEESRARYGSNRLTVVEQDPLWKKILEGFKDPMIMILMVALAVQLVLYTMGQAEWYEPFGVFVAIVIANGVAAVSENSQEGKAAELCKERRYYTRDAWKRNKKRRKIQSIYDKQSHIEDIKPIDINTFSSSSTNTVINISSVYASGNRFRIGTISNDSNTRNLEISII